MKMRRQTSAVRVTWKFPFFDFEKNSTLNNNVTYNSANPSARERTFTLNYGNYSDLAFMDPEFDHLYENPEGENNNNFHNERVIIFKLNTLFSQT